MSLATAVKSRPLIFTDTMPAVLNTRPGAWPAEPIDPARACKWVTRRLMKEIRDGHNFPFTEDMSLWVKERWGMLDPYGVMVRAGVGGGTANTSDRQTLSIVYQADHMILGDRWRTPLFMPRWASRVELEVVSVRGERLQEITPDDVAAEGMTGCVANYAVAWDRINGKKAAWADNPRVWRIEFKRTK